MKHRILTFDVEDWFHILDYEGAANISTWWKYESRIEAGLKRILDILADADQKATFFILGWVAEQYPELVKTIVENGHELGNHTYSHPLCYNLTDHEFKSEVEKAQQYIFEATNELPRYFRAPGFSIVESNIGFMKILIELGFWADASIFPAKRAHGGIKNFKCRTPFVWRDGDKSLYELPLSVARFGPFEAVVSGGGYFRIFPESLIARTFKKESYTMTYFHPRDFDPDQPILSGLGYLRKFKSYVGLKYSERKLRSLLRDFDFITIGQALSMPGFDCNIPTIQLNEYGEQR